MDKPKKLHQKFLNMVSVFIITLICVLTLNPVAFAADTGNEWVYDESNVISKDTEDYIKNLQSHHICISIIQSRAQRAISADRR